MIEYFKLILPRIQEFKISFDLKNIIVNQPFAFIDSNERKQNLIFKKNGELIVSTNGKVTMGKWELLTKANSFILDINGEKLLYQIVIADIGIVVLKINRDDNDIFVLINENLIQSFDIETNILKYLFKSLNWVTVKLQNGEELIILKKTRDEFIGTIGQYVFYKGYPAPDGCYNSKVSGVIYYVVECKIIRKSIIEEVTTYEGKMLRIEKFFNNLDDRIGKGDLIRSANGDIVLDGSYHTKNGVYTTRNGVIQ